MFDIGKLFFVELVVLDIEYIDLELMYVDFFNILFLDC